MNSPQRDLARRAAPMIVAAASAVSAMLIVPSVASAQDAIAGTCEVQVSANGNGNIVVMDQGTAKNAHLRQSGSWVAEVTGLDSYLDRGDDSSADTYRLRLRRAGRLTDIPCTTAPAPSCSVEAGALGFDPGIYSSMHLRRHGSWFADVTGTSTRAVDEVDGYVLRLRLADETEMTDVHCDHIAGSSDAEPISSAECSYVIADDGTSFEFVGDGTLDLRADDRWLRTVTGMSTLAVAGGQDAEYTVVHRRGGIKTIVPCSNLTPEPTVGAVEPTVDGCSISELLVPSCGVWLGADAPAYGTKGTSAAGVDQYESAAKNTPDILHFYKRNDQVWPTANEIALANRPGRDQQSLLFYNWKPSTSLTWAQVAAGRADDNIAVVAENLKKYPNKLWLAIYHEPEDNVVLTEGSGMTPADYVAMFRHTVSELEAHGVTNAVYTWNLMGFERWWPMFDALYPGDDVVDWVCYDPYQQGRNTDMSLLIDGDTGRGTYTRLAEVAPDKPMCLAEWGVNVDLDNPVEFFENTDAEAVLAEFPQLKMLMYWNAKDRYDYSLNTPTEKGAALAAGYAEFAASPIFNSMFPSDVPG